MTQFISDCEGPLTKNDNAQEITAKFIPQGEELYVRLSKYDDILAYVVKRKAYKAGDTLKLVLPFLKAYGVTNKKIEEYSKENLILIPAVKETLKYIREKMPCFIISTSYKPYIQALCESIDFPIENTYSTDLDLDFLGIEEKERKELLDYIQEITNLPMLEWPDGVSEFSALPDETQKTVTRLNEIFWDKIAKFNTGKFLEQVNPVGGKEKAKAIIDSLQRTSAFYEEVIYVGDSITDVEAFRLVKQNDGLTVSFNGNRYALNIAEIACLSDSAVILAILADLFTRFGKNKTLELAKNWDKLRLVDYIDKEWLEKLAGSQCKVRLVTEENKPEIVAESEKFRKSFRGEKIGGIG